MEHNKLQICSPLKKLPMLNSTHIFTSEREKLSDNVRSNIPKIFFRKAIGSSTLDPFIIGWDFLVQGKMEDAGLSKRTSNRSFLSQKCLELARSNLIANESQSTETLFHRNSFSFLIAAISFKLKSIALTIPNWGE